MDPIQYIRTRTREEWEEFARAHLQQFRLWVQNHGEISLILGLIFGIVFVLMFKLFVGLFVFGLLGGFLVWHIALPADEIQPK